LVFASGARGQGRPPLLSKGPPETWLFFPWSHEQSKANQTRIDAVRDAGTRLRPAVEASGLGQPGGSPPAAGYYQEPGPPAAANGCRWISTAAALAAAGFADGAPPVAITAGPTVADSDGRRGLPCSAWCSSAGPGPLFSKCNVDLTKAALGAGALSTNPAHEHPPTPGDLTSPTGWSRVQCSRRFIEERTGPVVGCSSGEPTGPPILPECRSCFAHECPAGPACRS